MNEKYIKEDLQKKGFVNVSYPPHLRSAVSDAVSSWKHFCTLPKETKKRFTYEEGIGFDGVGYELKEEAGKTKDLKENFHVTLGGLSYLEDLAKKVDDSFVAKFIHDANSLISLAEPLILDFAQALQDNFSLDNFVDEVKGARKEWILRYLHYFGDRKPGEEIASAHADKSGFTLHLFESAPGLQYLGFDKEWRDMPVSEGETVIIGNMQAQYRSENQIKALCHRVIATKETAQVGRFSVVCFIPFIKTAIFNKSVKGRMQEFAPGFNYEMSFGEFSELFIVDGKAEMM